MDECIAVLDANARRLTSAIRRIEALGIHKALIQFYMSQEPFYYFDDEFDRFESRFPQQKFYVANIDKPDHYEGEVNAAGNAYGRGIKIREFHDILVISEGFFINNSEIIGLRRVTNLVKKDLFCQMITGMFDGELPFGICSTALSNGFKGQGYYKNGCLTGLGKFQKIGCSYVGEINQGNAHGKGILTQNDGTVEKGMFINGKFKLAVDFPEDFLMQ